MMYVLYVVNMEYILMQDEVVIIVQIVITPLENHIIDFL